MNRLYVHNHLANLHVLTSRGQRRRIVSPGWVVWCVMWRSVRGQEANPVVIQDASVHFDTINPDFLPR